METSDTAEPAIIIRESDATMQPTPQDNELMSKPRVLSLKPQLRLEWRGQDGQNETEQPDHSASLGDSITSSTQIRFSVHTSADQRLSRSTVAAGDATICTSTYDSVTGNEQLSPRQTNAAPSAVA